MSRGTTSHHLCAHAVSGRGSGTGVSVARPRATFTPKPGLRFRESLAELPKAFRRYLVAVGVFGLGDFSHTLLILSSILLLEPTYGREFALVVGPLLYALRNTVAAIVAYPVGALSDRIGRRGLLVSGYLVGVGVMLGFAAAFTWDVHSLGLVIGLFVLAGVYIAVQESLEGAMTADLIPERARRGTAYGVLGCVNGIGDFAASFVVGLLITQEPGGWLPLCGRVDGAGAVAMVMVRRAPT